MPRRYLDLSVALEAGIASDPPIMLPQITYLNHSVTAPQIASFFDGLTQDQLPGGEGWAVEQLFVSTHNGTHLDAPYHHHSTMNKGERAWTIDEVPLEWCFNPGVKLDFRHLPDGHVVSAAEVEAELARIGHELQPLDIVLVNTSAGARYGEPDGAQRHPGRAGSGPGACVARQRQPVCLHVAEWRAARRRQGALLCPVLHQHLRQ